MIHPSYLPRLIIIFSWFFCLRFLFGWYEKIQFGILDQHLNIISTGCCFSSPLIYRNNKWGIAEKDWDENEQPSQTNSRIFISFQFVVCLSAMVISALLFVQFIVCCFWIRMERSGGDCKGYWTFQFVWYFTSDGFQASILSNSDAFTRK